MKTPKYAPEDEKLIRSYYGARGFTIDFKTWEVREPESNKLIGYHNGHELKATQDSIELTVHFVSIFDINCVTVNIPL